MTFEPHEIAFTSSTIYRLAQAVETHVQNRELAARLRTLAVRIESQPFIGVSPGLSETASLASGLNRFIGSLRHFGRKQHDARVAADLREILQVTENALALQARMSGAQRVAGLYVIVDPEHTNGRNVVDVARTALKGGASAIQYRDKVHTIGEQLPVAHELRDLCEQYDASFIINDSASLATSSGAHGLHLGQKDLPIYEARRILYSSQFIGKSNALLEEAQTALSEGVDYVGVGAIFPTNAKTNIRLAGIETLRIVRQFVSDIPLVAIGGIDLDNIDAVLSAGADSVCLISAVCQADDPEQAAAVLVERIKAHQAADAEDAGGV